MANVGTPLPWNLREKIKELILSGMTCRNVAAKLQISTRTVVKYARRKCTTSPPCSDCK